MASSSAVSAAPASATSAAPVIEIAQFAGVCYGVERALDLAHKAAAAAPVASSGDAPGKSTVATLGPLIHNPLVVRELEEAGVTSVDSVSACQAETLIIRAHGVVPQVFDEAAARGLNVIDATCPYVKKVHHAAERLVREGYQLLVVGESGHPEVEGIMGHAGKGAYVVSTPADLDALELRQKVGVVVQTTQTAEALSAIVSALVGRVSELHVVNTICAATQERQNSAAALAARADVMIVVGGKNSGNTRRLAQICAAHCARMHHIEDAAELEAAWFGNASLIGVTAGASTPAAHIDRTVEAIRALTGACERS